MEVFLHPPVQLSPIHHTSHLTPPHLVHHSTTPPTSLHHTSHITPPHLAQHSTTPRTLLHHTSHITPALLAPHSSAPSYPPQYIEAFLFLVFFALSSFLSLPLQALNLSPAPSRYLILSSSSTYRASWAWFEPISQTWYTHAPTPVYTHTHTARLLLRYSGILETTLAICIFNSSSSFGFAFNKRARANARTHTRTRTDIPKPR